eukprot:CAMPEP_0179011254 /NCGR_PEP_ID=MMETSP0796-20121207/567_1 /TAXON_ID=73915 /ORGANISM="Pyrodinium bahamense, Strain pbaha01" /LENGTH=367 /DNA_ID=CAMNT_0020706623 /DNA_START=245 /DNA_END=1344 /DNA_ORIENTATION=-
MAVLPAILLANRDLLFQVPDGTVVDEDQQVALCAILPAWPLCSLGELALEDTDACGLQELVQALRAHALPGAQQRRGGPAAPVLHGGRRLRLVGRGGRGRPRLGLGLLVAGLAALAGVQQKVALQVDAGALFAAARPRRQVVDLHAPQGGRALEDGQDQRPLHADREAHVARGLLPLGEDEVPVLQSAHVCVAGHGHGAAEHVPVEVVLVPDGNLDRLRDALGRPGVAGLPLRVLMRPLVRHRAPDLPVVNSDDGIGVHPPELREGPREVRAVQLQGEATVRNLRGGLLGLAQGAARGLWQPHAQVLAADCMAQCGLRQLQDQVRAHVLVDGCLVPHQLPAWRGQDVVVLHGATSRAGGLLRAHLRS